MKLWHKILFITLGILGLIGLLFIIWINYRAVVTTFFAYAFDRQTLIDLLRHQEKHNAVLFMAVIAIGSAIPGMPIAAVAVLSGVCFGSWLGFGINIVGTFLGNLLALYILGKFPHKVRKSRFRPIADRLKNMNHPRIGLSIGYAIPMLPTLLVNYAAIEMKMSLRNKAICILVGSLPVSFLYAFGGDALLLGNTKAVITIVILILLLFGLYEIIRRDQRIIKARN
ncbi:TVP38/TMEM64 family protein [Companilactobacillus huachuanensis]|uniref:TVP38/TMEM64 family protein n=1 Tax=Companilactobacillus huachuanensis TaxID=2559914 RepID=A0ABW1RHK9_9LACO|nr:VTT domain-containing protein [Companilactobacillus huachuanensis]